MRRPLDLLGSRDHAHPAELPMPNPWAEAAAWRWLTRAIPRLGPLRVAMLRVILARGERP